MYFENDSDRLTSEARDDLRSAARWLDGNPHSNLAVAGHADRAGTMGHNLTLSIRRARTVRDYLVAVGANPRRIVSYAYGESKAGAMASVSRRVLVYAVDARQGPLRVSNRTPSARR